MLVLTAAGNDGRLEAPGWGVGTVSAPANAKNTLAVGATPNLDADSGADGTLLLRLWTEPGDAAAGAADAAAQPLDFDFEVRRSSGAGGGGGGATGPCMDAGPPCVPACGVWDGERRWRAEEQQEPLGASALMGGRVARVRGGYASRPSPSGPSCLTGAPPACRPSNDLRPSSKPACLPAAHACMAAPGPAASRLHRPAAPFLPFPALHPRWRYSCRRRALRRCCCSRASCWRPCRPRPAPAARRSRSRCCRRPPHAMPAFPSCCWRCAATARAPPRRGRAGAGLGF